MISCYPVALRSDLYFCVSGFDCFFQGVESLAVDDAVERSDEFFICTVRGDTEMDLGIFSGSLAEFSRYAVFFCRIDCKHGARDHPVVGSGNKHSVFFSDPAFRFPVGGFGRLQGTVTGVKHGK